MSNLSFFPTRNQFGSLIDNFFNVEPFTNARSWSSPAVNIAEADDHFAIEVAAPGLSKEDFNITLDKDNLLISVDKSNNTEEKNEAGKVIRSEFNYMKFSRNFHLSDMIDRENVHASYDNGILKIRLDKMPEAKTLPAKTIEIK